MLTLLFAVVLMAGLIFRASSVTDAAAQALSVCARLIVPSLFPFFVASTLLNRLAFPQRLAAIARKGAGISAFFIGICGGYPLGAAAVADMYKSGTLNRDEAETLLLFCNNSGPAFIVGAVGVGVFASVKLGLMLYSVHIFSALIICLFFGREALSRREACELYPMPLSEALPEAVRSSVTAVLNVCGFVTTFTVLEALTNLPYAAAFLSSRTGFDSAFLQSFLCGILELGSGISSMSGLAPTSENLALAAFMLGFGGLSVHCQTLAVIRAANLKGVLHFSGRLLSGSIAAVTVYLIMKLI